MMNEWKGTKNEDVDVSSDSILQLKVNEKK